MSEQQSAVERLAEQWNTTPDYAPTEYDRGRVDQRHEMTMQLLEAIEADRAGVVAEEPEGRRWFTAAYRARNGNVIAIGLETVIAADAQATVDEFRREDDEGPEYFLASRVIPPWVPVKQEGTDDDVRA